MEASSLHASPFVGLDSEKMLPESLDNFRDFWLAFRCFNLILLDVCKKLFLLLEQPKLAGL